jgi:hypothetical protein
MQRADVLGTSVLLAVVAAGVAADPQSPAVRAARAPVRLQALAPRTRLSGIVVTLEPPPRPVNGITVKARDEAGRVVGSERTDSAGRFAFGLDQPGSYFVEAVDGRGRVLAVEDVGPVAITVDPGRDVTTILRIAAHGPAGAWTSTAAMILGAASAAGIGAFTASGQPASPER